MSSTETTELIESNFSHFIIIGCAIGGLVWGGVNAMFVSLATKHQFSSWLCLSHSQAYQIFAVDSEKLANTTFLINIG